MILSLHMMIKIKDLKQQLFKHLWTND